MSFITLNVENIPSTIDVLPSSLDARPGTDLWRKPPSIDVSNIPAAYKRIPAKDFKRARVTVTAKWSRQYDQGGLVFFLPGWPERKVWVKTGIEFVDGQPCVSVVGGRDDASDWSLIPSNSDSADADTVTIELEREGVDDKGNGSSLWVYKVEKGNRIAIRELTWAFKEEELEGEIGVGIYAARPTKIPDEHEGGESLTVNFTNFEAVP
ncbi:hypothetical protein Clacol_000379 [Clathrus columnatus]|uniref:Uncharacterized protein n=1 Tax=Clathrus columnatus TaxID=1419009 RepID=A0AAV5A2S6_9AGAM|nr:hypothetical protein Clacol_000379 [Clathrus columnatus]